jgi:hypothetical protein
MIESRLFKKIRGCSRDHRIHDQLNWWDRAAFIYAIHSFLHNLIPVDSVYNFGWAGRRCPYFANLDGAQISTRTSERDLVFERGVFVGEAGG